VPGDNFSRRLEPLVGLVIILRVGIILVVWMLLFLAMFLGYFTIPVFVVILLTLVYAITDFGLYVAINRNGSGRRGEKEEQVEANPDAEANDSQQVEE
jgi:hypothetical protein